MLQKPKNAIYQAFRRSESFFKTDMVYLAKGSFWFSFAQVIVSLSSFALAVAFAHFVNKEAYGQYKYILSLAGLLGTFTLTGLPPAVLRSITKGYEGSLSHAFWKNIKWSTLLFIAALSMSGYYFAHGNSSLGISLLLVGSLWPWFQSSNLYNSYLISKKDFKRNAIYFDIIGNLFPIACLLVAMSITANPVWLVAVYLASNTFIGLIMYRKVVTFYKPKGEIDPEMLGYSKHLSLMNIVTGIAANLDQVLIFHYIGAAELAIYNFAIAIPNQTKGPLKGLRNLIFPKFIERSDKEIKAGIGRKFLMLFALGLAITVVYIALAPYIYKIFFPKYLDAVFYSQIFALSILSITFSPADIYLAAKKKIGEQYILNVTMSVIQIIVVAIAVIFWGLFGLIVARVVLRLITSILSFFIYRHSIRLAISQ